MSQKYALRVIRCPMDEYHSVENMEQALASAGIACSFEGHDISTDSVWFSCQLDTDLTNLPRGMGHYVETYDASFSPHIAQHQSVVPLGL